MSTLVRYTPQDRVLDLAHLSPTDYTLITGLHGTIRHGDRVLICLRPGSGDDEMYIRKRGVKHFAVHYPGGAHGPHPVVLETDGHRRQKDYWARAAEDNGLHARIEMPVRGGKMDVAITGGDVATDIEVWSRLAQAASCAPTASTHWKPGSTSTPREPQATAA